MSNVVAKPKYGLKTIRDAAEFGTDKRNVSKGNTLLFEYLSKLTGQKNKP